MKRSAKNATRAVVDGLADQLRGALTPGASFEGVLTVDDLDVEITVRVRRAVSRDQAVVHRDAALELLSTEGWRDHCAAYVKDRSPWRSVKGTTRCSKPVTSVVAFKAYDGTVAYSFRCSCHVNDHGRDARSVLATVTLSPPALKVARAKRKRDQEERDAFNRMSDVEKVAHDAREERKPAAVIEQILAQNASTNDVPPEPTAVHAKLSGFLAGEFTRKEGRRCVRVDLEYSLPGGYRPDRLRTWTREDEPELFDNFVQIEQLASTIIEIAEGHADSLGLGSHRFLVYTHQYLGGKATCAFKISPSYEGRAKTALKEPTHRLLDAGTAGDT